MHVHINSSVLMLRLYTTVFLQGGWSPLQCAASNGKNETVKLLMEHEADINFVDKVCNIVCIT